MYIPAFEELVGLRPTTTSAEFHEENNSPQHCPPKLIDLPSQLAATRTWLQSELSVGLNICVSSSLAASS